MLTKTILLALSALASAHGNLQTPIAGPHQSLWYNTLPGDGGTQVSYPHIVRNQWLIVQADSVFSGISTFGRLPYFPCLSSESEKYDIAFIGTPPQDHASL